MPLKLLGAGYTIDDDMKMEKINITNINFYCKRQKSTSKNLADLHGLQDLILTSTVC